MRCHAGACLWLLPLLAAAAPADERAALAQRRQAVEQAFQAAQVECTSRFAVSACLEAARLKRRDDWVALQKAEAALDARDRRHAAQSRAVEARSDARQASSPQAASAPLRVRAPAVPASGVLHARPPAGTGVPGRAAAERRARAAYERRQMEAESRRRQVEQRNAQRPSKAAPLPIPPAASSATR